MKTIGDMPNEKDFFYNCNEFEFNHDFLKILWKTNDALWVYEVFYNNVYLYEKDKNKIFIV